MALVVVDDFSELPSLSDLDREPLLEAVAGRFDESDAVGALRVDAAVAGRPLVLSFCSSFAVDFLSIYVKKPEDPEKPD